VKTEPLDAITLKVWWSPLVAIADDGDLHGESPYAGSG
jgi:hypothetical protein